MVSRLADSGKTDSRQFGYSGSLHGKSPESPIMSEPLEILLIEDSETDRILVEQLLRKAFGDACRVASNSSLSAALGRLGVGASQPRKNWGCGVYYVGPAATMSHGCLIKRLSVIEQREH